MGIRVFFTFLVDTRGLPCYIQYMTKQKNIYTVTVFRKFTAPHPQAGTETIENIPGCSLAWAQNWRRLVGTSDGYGIQYVGVIYRRT